MEDYSSNEKVKPEKQRRNIMLCFLVSIYIYIISICVMYVLSCLSIYSFIKICYFSHLTLKLFLQKFLYDSLI